MSLLLNTKDKSHAIIFYSAKINMKKLLYIDLDGVVADFVSAMNAHPLRHTPPYHEDPDTIPGLFRNLEPLKDAVDSVNKLLDSKKYEVYFLSTAPCGNTSAWSDKRIWLEEQFGDKINRKLGI